MNIARRDRFRGKDSLEPSKVDNEIQMLVDIHNRHDSGLVGWNALAVKDGSNLTMGQAILSGGTILVNNTKVTANSRFFLSHANTGGTLGHLYIAARVASTSFTITSSSNLDTSTVNWLFIEPK